MLVALRRVDCWRRRVGGVERAKACTRGSSRTARRMAVSCEADDGLVASDPPKMTKGGVKGPKKQKKKHTIPLDH